MAFVHRGLWVALRHFQRDLIRLLARLNGKFHNYIRVGSVSGCTGFHLHLEPMCFVTHYQLQLVAADLHA